jgi:hypothetical protein
MGWSVVNSLDDISWLFFLVYMVIGGNLFCFVFESLSLVSLHYEKHSFMAISFGKSNVEG